MEKKTLKSTATEIINRRKALQAETATLQIQQIAVLVEVEMDPERKADLAWVLDRRKRKVRLHIKELGIAADAMESSCIPVAGGTLVGFKLFIDAIGAQANSPLYIIGSVMAAVVWAVLKLNAVRMKSKAQTLTTGIGD